MTCGVACQLMDLSLADLCRPVDGASCSDKLRLRVDFEDFSPFSWSDTPTSRPAECGLACLWEPPSRTEGRFACHFRGVPRNLKSAHRLLPSFLSKGSTPPPAVMKLRNCTLPNTEILLCLPMLPWPLQPMQVPAGTSCQVSCREPFFGQACASASACA